MLVVVDTTHGDGPPGSLYLLEHDLAAMSGDAAFDPHGMEPDAVLELIGALARGVGTHGLDRVLVLGCEPAHLGEGMGLTPAVTTAVEEAVDAVHRLVERLIEGRPLEPRTTTTKETTDEDDPRGSGAARRRLGGEGVDRPTSSGTCACGRCSRTTLSGRSRDARVRGGRVGPRGGRGARRGPAGGGPAPARGRAPAARPRRLRPGLRAGRRRWCGRRGDTSTSSRWRSRSAATPATTAPSPTSSSPPARSCGAHDLELRPRRRPRPGIDHHRGPCGRRSRRCADVPGHPGRARGDGDRRHRPGTGLGGRRAAARSTSAC